MITEKAQMFIIARETKTVTCISMCILFLSSQNQNLKTHNSNKNLGGFRVTCVSAERATRSQEGVVDRLEREPRGSRRPSALGRETREWADPSVIEGEAENGQDRQSTRLATWERRLSSKSMAGELRTPTKNPKIVGVGGWRTGDDAESGEKLGK